MRKLKIAVTSITIVIFMLVLLANCKVFASSNQNLFQMEEYTEEFKEWLKLSDEEKENVIMPRMYIIENSNIESKNPLNIARMLKASINTKYSLKDVIPSNLVIKDQQQTNSCWAFASLSSLETNLALYNYKNNINLSKVFDYSERHMEYATSKTFANNMENNIGYNRKAGSGGNYQFASSYLTNGTGAISETEMPFENNENIIDIEQIQNKTVSSQIYDTIVFPDYRYESDENRTEIMNQIKQHIQNYGSVMASIHGASDSSFGSNCYNDETAAKFCNNSISHTTDHAISIIGWDDNYSIDNFIEGSRPKSAGAWIIRNSWGERLEYILADLKEEIFKTYRQQCINSGWNSAEEIPNSFITDNGYTIEGNIAYILNGDHGLYYISYEDVNISKEMFGIIKSADTVDYDYIYQYDKFFPTMQLTLNSSNMILCNIFNKNTTETEYLEQVSLYAPETYTCKVYVNPNGSGKSKSDLQLVQLKAGESETVSAGYHTLEFLNPVELKSNSFAVVIEIQSSKSSVKLPIESKVNGVTEYASVTVETGKCFVSPGNNLENAQWNDLSKLTEQNSSLVNGDSSIKAFTTTQLSDTSLKSIEISTPPTKTSYFEGEDFDKTGMVVKANYNSKTNPSVVLDSSSYGITNGTNLQEGQASVTITYEGKSVNQPISVVKNNVESLEITTPPTKISYKEGQNFDKTGMVIKAKFKDTTTKIITDYTIENGSNLIANQTSVTISYGGKTIEQNITVTSNPLMEIKVTKAPNKTKYVVGQNFDKTGMIVTGIYQDETTQEIFNYTIENGTSLTKEQSSITIKYGGKTATQSITVEEKVVTSISVNKKPIKIQYIQNKENLDLQGGTLKVNYNDNSSEEISLTSEQIKITGFDNTKLGKNTISIEYQSKIATLDLEIIEEETAQNSNFDNANSKINSTKYYTFSNENTQEYLILDITINGITRNTKNDSVEYYYYLSSNQDEANIENWVKIKENQNSNDKLAFAINTKDIKNYSEISDADTLYLYIKEVAIKGGNQSVFLSKSMKLEATDNIETYVDGIKKENIQSNISNTNGKIDNTTAPNKLPQAGTSIIVFLVAVFVLGMGIYVYIRYKNLSKYVK